MPLPPAPDLQQLLDSVPPVQDQASADRRLRAAMNRFLAETLAA